MKVIFTLDTLGNSGTEKSTLDIISAFSPDTEIKVVAFFPGNDLRQSFADANIPVFDLNLSPKNSWINAIAEFKKIIKNEKPDVVVSSILRSNIISRIACWQTNTKLVGTFVSDSYSNIRIQSFSLKRKIAFYFFYFLDRITSSIPKLWISNSNYIKQSNCLKLNINSKLVEVIYRGRNSEFFKEKINRLKNNSFRFVFVARLLETKGLKELIDAFAEVSKKHPEATLSIYGEGNFKTKIIQQIQRLQLENKIVLHGMVPDAWKNLYEADCFIFPSWYEGFSGSLVEAMLVGIPIIASDIPMNLEAVTNNKTALIYEVKNTEQLTAQMIKSITSYDKMIELGAAARKEALVRFDIKIIASQYENILKRVAESR